MTELNLHEDFRKQQWDEQHRELDALRAARDELLDTDAFHARHCLVEQDNDRLRAEKVDLEYRLGLQVRDAIALQREVFALRARLVQTEAVVEAARIYVGGLPATGSRYDAVVAALRGLPEAPPSEKPHINPDCGRCQIAGCTEHAVQCIATDRHTRDRHLRGKPYGYPEAPPVAAGPEWPGVQNMDPSESLL